MGCPFASKRMATGKFMREPERFAMASQSIRIVLLNGHFVEFQMSGQ
jgi:hypothetical protein